MTAERFVRDWLGSYVAGRAAPVGHIVAASFDGTRAVESEVFRAAALSHVTETDDLHRASVTHPGCVVVPTAWLVARDVGCDGRRFLHAVIGGYEVMTRVGEALGAAHYRIFHNTATAGVFGSAAAAAHLLDLDEDGWVWALGNAGTQAAGLWQFNEEGAMSKPLHAGHAAAAGLRAAILAKHGLTGPENILEGEKGFFRALCPDARPDVVLADAAEWKIGETSLKPYPCCRHTHPAIDAALALRRRLDPGVLPARIHVLSYPAAVDVTNRPHPRTPHEARFSLQYAVARTLVAGRPGLAAFEGAAISDAAVRTVLERTTISVDPALSAAYPERWGATLEVQLEDGTTVCEHCTSAAGDPEKPLSEAALDAKLLDLFAWAGLTTRRSRDLLRRCLELPAGGRMFALPRLR